MKHLINLTDWSREDILHVFELARRCEAGQVERRDGCAVLFFPASSLRTRVTFERACHLLGLQPILFPPETLDKPEELRDVIGYLQNWVSVVVARVSDITRLRELSEHAAVPVINAMTKVNHPCEVLSDVYALSKIRADWADLEYLFVGADGNIGRAWWEIAQVLGLNFRQCSPAELRMDGPVWTDDLTGAVRSADVVLTDGVGPYREQLAPYQVTGALLATAKPGVILNPCPPYERGAEVDASAIDSPAFSGYAAKAALLPVQMSVILHCLEG